MRSIRTLLAAAALAVLFAGSASAALIDRGDGVVTDTTTGLDWERAPSNDWHYWSDASVYASNLALAGGGWRLPTIAELFSLYDGISAITGCSDCSGAQWIFPDLEIAYWTSQQYFSGQWGAFYVGFWVPDYYAGIFQANSRVAAWAVRATRPMVVPEPSAAVLLLVALGALLAVRRRAYYF